MGEATGVPICDSVRSGEAISIGARGSPSLVGGRLESLRRFRRTLGGESPTSKLLKEADKEIGHQKTITSLSKSADGSHFLTGSSDKFAKMSGKAEEGILLAPNC
ncbi:hypothetical protein ZIOFF_075196 [Zingiber officinale]|uniref:Uncharacterized protein n=1 Tax=Zingiber officinale TaxID=94328 RepID=A0A8J5C1M0_ZINOF|nr:hypothetical protein ZIOFF_075196 [Zingiber officinale]